MVKQQPFCRRANTCLQTQLFCLALPLGHAELAACSSVTSSTCMLLLCQDCTQGCLDERNFAGQACSERASCCGTWAWLASTDWVQVNVHDVCCVLADACSSKQSVPREGACGQHLCKGQALKQGVPSSWVQVCMVSPGGSRSADSSIGC